MGEFDVTGVDPHDPVPPHLSVPWQIIPHNTSFAIIDANGHVVAWMAPQKHPLGAQADAEFLIRAVNDHAKLLDLCDSVAARLIAIGRMEIECGETARGSDCTDIGQSILNIIENIGSGS